MRNNAIPALIAFSPALLLPLVQEVIRPHAAHVGLIGFVLGWAPNFVIGFCFPFSILTRPRVWSSRVATNLFHVWSAFTVIVLVAFEIHDPLGPQTFDPADIVASVVAVALALIVFHALLRSRLTFGDDLPGSAESEPVTRSTV
ncbi:MAG TPA: hypothetical protein VIA62_07750 [Thermoanaerobaculia bacterium]|jgi:hypothetical protein|nr:hypothetical protein [Thermoanaerobaculia bacterium]